MSNVIRGRWPGWFAAAGLVAAIAASAMTFGVKQAAAQDAGTIMKANPPLTEVKKGDDRIPVDITIENATNMASFQFILQYNADILDAADAAGGPVVQKGDFLGSSGREVVCADPTIEPGAIRYTCVTLRPTPAGPDGSGKLATVYLKAIGSGKTNLTLDHVKANLADDSATEIALSVQNAPIDVKGNGGGMAWWVWAVIVAGGVIVGLAAVGGVLVLRTRGGSGSPATVA
jgi:hypothetical protein